MQTLPAEILLENLRKTERPALFQTTQVSHLWRKLAFRQVVPLDTYTECLAAGKAGDLLSMIHSPIRLLNAALYGACEGNHRELVERLLMQGATDFNGGLYGAYKGGHQPLCDGLYMENIKVSSKQ